MQLKRLDQIRTVIAILAVVAVVGVFFWNMENPEITNDVIQTRTAIAGLIAVVIIGVLLSLPYLFSLRENQQKPEDFSKSVRMQGGKKL